MADEQDPNVKYRYVHMRVPSEGSSFYVVDGGEKQYIKAYLPEGLVVCGKNLDGCSLFCHASEKNILAKKKGMPIVRRVRYLEPETPMIVLVRPTSQGRERVEVEAWALARALKSWFDELEKKRSSEDEASARFIDDAVAKAARVESDVAVENSSDATCEGTTSAKPLCDGVESGECAGAQNDRPSGSASAPVAECEDGEKDEDGTDGDNMSESATSEGTSENGTARADKHEEPPRKARKPESAEYVQRFLKADASVAARIRRALKTPKGIER